MVSFGPVMRGELVEIVQRQTAIDGQVFGCPQFQRLTVGQEKIGEERRESLQRQVGEVWLYRPILAIGIPGTAMPLLGNWHWQTFAGRINQDQRSWFA
jgi:hypothetical protein